MLFILHNMMYLNLLINITLHTTICDLNFVRYQFNQQTYLNVKYN